VGAGSLWPPNPTNAIAFFVGVGMDGWMGWWFEGCCKNLAGLLSIILIQKSQNRGGKKKKNQKKGY
jgi:hypothetical protein